MLTLAEARACLAAQIVPAPPVPLPLPEARGRVLREEVRAPHDLPAFDRSAMDGYAVALDDRSERFRVVGEVQPGRPAELVLQMGECARIFTGAAIPAGASQVIMQEEAARDGEWMIPQARDRATNIRRRGEDVREGALLLSPGQRLGAAGLALLAHLGHMRPLVSPAPRILHIATGRELVPLEQIPGPGEIRDSNSTLIAALLTEAGAGPIGQKHCGDEPGQLAGIIEKEPAESWDGLLISGGASVGDYDCGAETLRGLGFAIHFEQVSLRPGKPLVFATRGRQWAFVIPGNPVSHFVLFHVAIRAALEASEGAAPSWPIVHLPLSAAIEEASSPRETFWPARLENGTVHPLRWQSSGDLSGIAGANAIIQIRPRTGALPSGAVVPCLLLGLA